MDVGPKASRSDMVQSLCKIDGIKKGSISRFINHSCEPNAYFQMMRCALHNRINIVAALRASELGEEISASYGKTCFWNDSCLY